MQVMYDDYHSQNFEIISICVEDALDSVKHYARLYDFLFLMDADQSTWSMYYQCGFTPIWYVLEADIDMTVHGWLENWDEDLFRMWIEECIGVEELPNQKVHSIKVGPNPTSGRLVITSQNSPITAQVFNISGQMIDEVQAEDNRLIWDGRHLQEGVYLIQIKSGKDSRLEKVTIIR